MFERSVGNATRRVNVTPFYVWTCSENYNLVVRFGIIFIITELKQEDFIMQEVQVLEATRTAPNSRGSVPDI